MFLTVHRPKLKLRGLPTSILFDKYYAMNTDNILNGHYTLDGFTSTVITYDKVNEEWRMELQSESTTYFATTGKNDDEYPFGIKTWNISSSLFSGTKELSLNGCDDNTEFNCGDGSCLPIENR